MKMIKAMLATIAVMAAISTPVQARDSISIGVNIGGYGHGYAGHVIRSHRHVPAFFGYYHAPIRHYAPPAVVYYAPRYNHYNPYVSSRRHFTRDHYRHSESRRGYRRHDERHHYRRGEERRYDRR